MSYTACCNCVQLDQTKTSDGKSNFLNVLVNAVTSTYPDAVSLADDLPSITDASRGDRTTRFPFVTIQLLENNKICPRILMAARLINARVMSSVSQSVS